MKRTITVLLALLMVLGLLTPAAFAYEADTHDIAFQWHPFTDVPYTAWYSQGVQYVWMRNIMQGPSPTSFNPAGHLTRAEVTALIFRLELGRRANDSDSRQNNFNDVGSGVNVWYAPYVTWAANNGLVHGTSPTTFNPHGRITRQEFAALVYRFAMSPMTELHDRYLGMGLDWHSFTDRGQIEPWAYDALRWMNFHAIIRGLPDNTINPNGHATRAEAAVMMMRFMELLGRTINGFPPGFAPEPGPQQPAPQGVNIAPLLGRNFNEVRHYFGTGGELSEPFRNEWIFPNGVRVALGRDSDGNPCLNSPIVGIDISFWGASSPTAFRWNDIDGTTTLAEAIEQLGEPHDIFQFDYDAFTYTFLVDGQDLRLVFELGSMSGIMLFLHSPTPQGVNIAGMTGRNFDEVRHYFTEFRRGGLGEGGAYYMYLSNFGGVTGGHASVQIAVCVLSRAIFSFNINIFSGVDDLDPAAFHFNGVFLTDTRIAVREKLGEPCAIISPWENASFYRYEFENSVLDIWFLEDDTAFLFMYGKMP